MAAQPCESLPAGDVRVDQESPPGAAGTAGQFAHVPGFGRLIEFGKAAKELPDLLVSPGEVLEPATTNVRRIS